MTTKLELITRSLFTENDVSSLIESNQIYSSEGRLLSHYANPSEQLLSVLEWKFEECNQRFIDSCRNDGIKTPVILEVDNRDLYMLSEGHHRMAVALEYNLPCMIYVVNNWSDVKEDFPYYYNDGLLLSDGRR